MTHETVMLTVNLEKELYIQVVQIKIMVVV